MADFCNFFMYPHNLEGFSEKGSMNFKNLVEVDLSTYITIQRSAFHGAPPSPGRGPHG